MSAGSSSSACRVCRKGKTPANGASFVSLLLKSSAFPNSGGGASLASMLQFVANITVKSDETDMPQEICMDCRGQLEASFQFRKKCVESDGIFRAAASSRKLMVASKQLMSQQKQQQQKLSNNQAQSSKASAMHLQDYNSSFYEIILNRYYYMELAFVAHRCCGCKLAFATVEELHDHSYSMHSQNQVGGILPQQCPICFHRFPYDDALQYHRKAMDSNVFCCRECFLIFEKKHALFGHLRSQHHRQEDELEREFYEETQQPEVPMGHSIFDPDPTDPQLMLSHVQSLAAAPSDDPLLDTFALGYCELSPNMKLDDLRPSQYRFMEQTEGFSIIEFTWHRCCACNHMFANRNELDIHCTEEHRKRQNPQTLTNNVLMKPFACELCWRRFKKKSLVSLHQKFNRKKIYVCNNCSNIFFGGPAYEKHLPCCGSAEQDGARDDSGPGQYQGFVGYPMMEDMKEEPEEDDGEDVYILDD